MVVLRRRSREEINGQGEEGLGRRQSEESDSELGLGVPKISVQRSPKSWKAHGGRRPMGTDWRWQQAQLQTIEQQKLNNIQESHVGRRTNGSRGARTSITSTAPFQWDEANHPGPPCDVLDESHRFLRDLCWGPRQCLDLPR